MTSSLVGSEMCIRDRSSRSRPLRRSASCSCAAAGTPERGRRRNASSPVSYTHLTLPTICSV
eukprot:584781-Prorocentrum_lima.AAC.1